MFLLYVSNNFFWTQRNCGGGRKKFGGALPPNAPRGYEPVPTTKSAKFTRRINVERAAERQESHSRPQANETLSRFEESSATNAGDAVHVEDQPVARKRVSGFAGSYAGAAARARRDDSAEKELCSCRTKKKNDRNQFFSGFSLLTKKNVTSICGFWAISVVARLCRVKLLLYFKKVTARIFFRKISCDKNLFSKEIIILMQIKNPTELYNKVCYKLYYKHAWSFLFLVVYHSTFRLWHMSAGLRLI